MDLHMRSVCGASFWKWRREVRIRAPRVSGTKNTSSSHRFSQMSFGPMTKSSLIKSLIIRAEKVYGSFCGLVLKTS